MSSVTNKKTNMLFIFDFVQLVSSCHWIFLTIQVLNACVQKKQWEGAFWVLQQLKQQSIAPSGTTYGLIMEVMLHRLINHKT